MIPWLYLGFAGVVFAVGLARLGLQGAKAGGWRASAANLLALVTLAPVALFAVHPYLGGNLVGAGDSYHYGLQVADFVTQARAGVMPIFVGQSDYAFNGNVHTLRTAPYFTHLAGLLDGVTGRTLSFVQLQNLTVTVTIVLAAWVAFGVTARLTGNRLTGWLLAALYVLSPAVMGPLSLQDMFATHMAMPWIILAWYGLARSLAEPGDATGPLVAGAALALTWYAHSPIAAWLSVPWAMVQAIVVFRAGGRQATWSRLAAGALLLSGLAAYAVTAFLSVGQGPPSAANYDAFAFSRELLERALRAEFTPFLVTPAAGIQLGYGLWAALLGATLILVWRRDPAGLGILPSLGLFVACLIPVPWLSETMWRTLPERLVTQTNWPAQRLDPLLAAGAVVLAALAWRKIAGRRTRRVATAVVVLGVAWSAAEVVRLHRRPNVAKLPASVQALQYSPQNLRLTRYSYALFPREPDYFTHGWADPEFESRLLDQSLNPAGDNFQAARGGATAAFEPIEGNRTLELAGEAEYLLDFTFADPAAAGELVIKGDDLYRSYTLPQSGRRLAFGSAAEAGHAVPLRLVSPGRQEVTVVCSVPGAAVRAVRIDREKLPVRLTGLMPYRADVHSPGPGYLETPRMYLAGYTAKVNGLPAPARLSPHDLVMVPVPAGESRVELTYRGPLVLRISWYVSLGVLALWPWVLSRRRRDEPAETRSLLAGLADLWRTRRRRVIVVTSCLLAAFALAWAVRMLLRDYGAYGPVVLRLEFPKDSPQRAEPLVTTGRTGQADAVYVIYEGKDQIRIGVDHWGFGGPISEPIPLRFDQPHTLEVDLGSLYPPSRWLGRPSLGATAEKPGRARLRVLLDNRPVFDLEHPFHAAAATEVFIGQNPVGMSSASALFTGTIISEERLPQTHPSRHP